MINKITEINYIKPNVGYFPSLINKINHGFTWGIEAGNMQFTNNNYDEVKANIQKIFDELELGYFKKAININAEHKDNIALIDEQYLKGLKRTHYGISINCDAAFTEIENLVLTVKPADCTTAIVYVQANNVKNSKALTGIIHSGRRGVEIGLPQKAVNYLVKELKIDPKDIQIAIVPHLFQKSRKFANIDDLNLEKWKGYIKEDNGYYYPAETEFAIDQYLEAGIQSENITVYEVDTYEAAKTGESFSQKLHWDITNTGGISKRGSFLVFTCIKT